MVGSSVLVGSSRMMSGTFGTSTVRSATFRFIPLDMCVSGRSMSISSLFASASTSGPGGSPRS